MLKSKLATKFELEGAKSAKLDPNGERAAAFGDEMTFLHKGRRRHSEFRVENSSAVENDSHSGGQSFEVKNCLQQQKKRPARSQQPDVYLEPKWLRCFVIDSFATLFRMRRVASA